MKYSISLGGTFEANPTAVMSDRMPSETPASSKLGKSHIWPASKTKSSCWASTRLSSTPLGLPATGTRRIVSGTFL
jgi:hypothetical protein